MKRKALCIAVAGACAALMLPATPAVADEMSDLKAEIAAQRARLEALEQKLDASAAAQQALAKDAATAKEAAAKAAADITTVQKVWQDYVHQREAPYDARLASVTDVGPGLSFQVTPVDTVTLYGLLDATLSSINNVSADGKHFNGWQNSWFSGNRWGIIGKHNLPNGMPSVIFKLESEFDIRTGEEDTAGVLFNRDAWIGFESETLGKLTFGRQNAMTRDPLGSAIYLDPYGRASVNTEEGGGTNTNNFKQLIFYAGSATGTRYDRGVVWKKRWGKNWFTGLAYQFGNVAGSPSSNSTQAVALGYNSDSNVWHASGFYDHAKVAGFDHRTWSVGGNVFVTPVVRLNAGYFNYTAEQPIVGGRRDNSWTISTKIAPEGKLDYELGYQVLRAHNAGFSGSGFTLAPFANTSGVKLAGTGDKKTFYGSIFYHLDSVTELYLAADNMKLTDGYKLAVTNGHSDQTEVALGLRFRF